MAHRPVLLTVSLLTLLSSVPLALAERTPGHRTYPAFGDRPKQAAPVEAAYDRGLLVELTVRCNRGIGIVTYSKAERLYCSADHRCGPRLESAIRATCN